MNSVAKGNASQRGRAARAGWVKCLLGGSVLLVSTLLVAAPMAKKERRLAIATVCCRTLDGLSFDPMEMGRPVNIWFGAGSQVFQFGDGARSYFHALRLPQTDNYYLSIQTYFDGSSHRFFRPRLLMLDRNLAVVEDVAPDTDLVKGAWGRFLRIAVKPKAEAAYLVLFSARPLPAATAVSDQRTVGDSAALSSSVRLAGLREVVFKMSPEGKVVVTAKPYRQALD